MELVEDTSRDGLNKILAAYANSINSLKAEVKRKFLSDPLYWQRRPLQENAIAYAARDVIYLLEVERKMSTQLGERRKAVLTRSRRDADNQRLAPSGRAEAICQTGTQELCYFLATKLLPRISSDFKRYVLLEGDR